MKYISVLYLILLAATFIGVFIESITHNGFVSKLLLINPETLSIFLLLISVASLFSKKELPFPKTIIKLNNFVLLPITFLFSFTLTILELINYSNFVYSTFHINFDISYYLFLTSLALAIISFDKKRLNLNFDKIVCISSIILILSALIIRTWPNGVFFNLIREDSLLEDLQFIFYLFAGISFVLFSIRNFKTNKIYFIYFLLFGLFLLFIAGEEISWGQRIIGIDSPQVAIQNNTQQETTLHNIKGLNDLQPIMYISFSFILSFGWIILRFLPKRFSILLPNWYFILYFLPILIFYIHINVFMGSNWQWQEACELFLSLGLFIFSQEKFFKRG